MFLTLSGFSASSSEFEFRRRLLLWEAEDAEPDVVRCRFISSLCLEAT